MLRFDRDSGMRRLAAVEGEQLRDEEDSDSKGPAFLGKLVVADYCSGYVLCKLEERTSG